MSLKKVKIGSFLKRIKNTTIIEDSKFYKRITIRTKHQGISKRDEVKGLNIGTKNQFIVSNGQFLLSKIDARLGAFGIVPIELNNGIITGNFWAYEVDEKIANIEWFNLFTSSGNFYEICNIASSGTTHRKYLDEKKFLNFEIDIPSVNEQSTFLEKFKKQKFNFVNLSAELQYQSDLIKKLRQSILQDAVQGKLVKQNSKDEPAGKLLEKIKAEKQKLITEGKLKKEKELSPISADEILFELPRNWVWCRFNEIALVDSGSTPDKKEFTDNSSDVPYFKVYNIVKQKIKFDYRPQYIKKQCHNGQLKRSMCYSGNVLMNIVGPPLGKVAIVPDEIEECNINQAIVVFRPFISKLNKWIYYYLCEMSAINAIVTKGTAGQDNISLTQSRELLIPIPPLSEQERIVAKVEELMQICDLLGKEVENSKTQLQQLMQSVLREAFEEKDTVTENTSNKLKKFTSTEKAILAGHIINLTNTEDFGRVKFQKLLYLTEHHCRLNLGSSYTQNVAGPYDGKLITEVESTLKRLGFYEIGRSKTGRQINYTALGSASQLETYFSGSFEKDSNAINDLLKKFKKSTWEQTEIVATLYAVWNNRILKKEPVTDEFLKQDFLAWDSQKKKYKDRLDAALVWMNEKQIIPDGWGKIIDII